MSTTIVRADLLPGFVPVHAANCSLTFCSTCSCGQREASRVFELLSATDTRWQPYTPDMIPLSEELNRIADNVGNTQFQAWYRQWLAL